jgi:hypothetical protein
MSRRRTALITAMATVASAVSFVLASSPADAQDQGCVIDIDTLQCGVEVEVPGPQVPPPVDGEPERPGQGGGDPGPSNPQPPPPDPGAGDGDGDCGAWEAIDGPVADGYRQDMGLPAGTPLQICADGNATGEMVRQAPEGDAAPVLPSPEQVAAGVLAEVENMISAPTVVMDPPEGTPSIVSLPVFVQVTNWQETFTEQGCDPTGAVCVDMTATPTLSFSPGEPGSSAVVCEPPGTRFDPNGADPVDQASVPGACAHVYTERTGVADRPAAWPAQVTVTWEVAWTSNVGQSGAFDPMALSTTVERQVNEVQTIVVDGSSS